MAELGNAFALRVKYYDIRPCNDLLIEFASFKLLKV